MRLLTFSLADGDLEHREVRSTTPDSRAVGRVSQQWERERAAHKKERARRHRERRERRSEEYWLRE
jgi:hypothetical protein